MVLTDVPRNENWTFQKVPLLRFVPFRSAPLRSEKRPLEPMSKTKTENIKLISYSLISTDFRPVFYEISEFDTGVFISGAEKKGRKMSLKGVLCRSKSPPILMGNFMRRSERENLVDLTVTVTSPQNLSIL